MNTQAFAIPLTMALSKGRIFEETLPLLKAAGIEVSEDPEKSRKLIIGTSDPGLRIIIVRASDVPTYVEYGAADLGIAGKDVLIEHAAQHPGGLYQPIDLNIAKCRLSVAVRNGFDYESAVKQGARLRVATKYVAAAREHFASKGVYVDLIKLYGSMELAPLVGLADAIVDLVSTGKTLKANDLVAVEDIMPISSRLIIESRRSQNSPATAPALDGRLCSSQPGFCGIIKAYPNPIMSRAIARTPHHGHDFQTGRQRPRLLTRPWSNCSRSMLHKTMPSTLLPLAFCVRFNFVVMKHSCLSPESLIAFRRNQSNTSKSHGKSSMQPLPTCQAHNATPLRPRQIAYAATMSTKNNRVGHLPSQTAHGLDSKSRLWTGLACTFLVARQPTPHRC